MKILRTEGSTLKQMSVDDLAERIKIIYFDVSKNTKGDIVKGDEKLRCKVWAKILPLNGKITDSTPEKINSVTYRITIRYRNDIKSDDEILWRGKKLKILTPPFDVEVRHIWTQFDCAEVIQDGSYQQTKT